MNGNEDITFFDPTLVTLGFVFGNSHADEGSGDPDRQCVAFVGDGGFSMLMADFVTAVKRKLPIKVVIVDNLSLGMIKWEQMVFLGNPDYVIDNAPIDFAEFAHACGGVGFSVDDPANCGETIDAFLNAPGPAILRAVVDPFEPPMPAKIKPEQALHFAESLARGEPRAHNQKHRVGQPAEHPGVGDEQCRWSVDHDRVEVVAQLLEQLR